MSRKRKNLQIKGLTYEFVGSYVRKEDAYTKADSYNKDEYYKRVRGVVSPYSVYVAKKENF